MNYRVWWLTGVGVDYLHLKYTQDILAVVTVDSESTV